LDSSTARPDRSRDESARPASYVLAAAVIFFALLAVAVIVRHGRPFGLDTDVLRWAVRHRPHPAVRVATLITDTGQGLPAYVLALAAGLGIGFAVGHSAWWKALDSLAALVFLALVEALRYGLAEAIGRHRPPLADRAIGVTGLAFPSGHTTNSAVIAGLFVLAALLSAYGRLLRTLVIATALAWAIAVGLSRIYLGVHWVTDVIGGWLLAVAVVSAAWRGAFSVISARRSR
jgi:membrane-associated phospholipid phosphatase